MTVVENSYYEHDEHGLVRVVDNSPDNVSFEINGEFIWSGTEKVPKAKKEEPGEFEQSTEPADVSVDADYIVMESVSKTP